MPARTVSWLQFYRAARHGDITVVRQGLSQGLEYKASSNLHVDVLGLAVENGHWQVLLTVLEFIENSKVKDTLDARSSVLMLAIPLVMKTTRKKLFRQLLDYLKDLQGEMKRGQAAESKIHYKNVLLECLEFCNLQMFRQAETFMKMTKTWYKMALMPAFNNGRAGVFEHIVRSSGLSLYQVERYSGIQEFFLAIAVGQGFEDDYYSGEHFFKNKKIILVPGTDNWHSPLCSAYDKACKERGPDSAFAVAARFGRLKMLRHLWEECAEYLNERDWAFVTRDMYREALRFGHKNIVNLLVKKSKNDMKLYISLENHLYEQYSNMPPSMYKLMMENYVEMLKKKSKAKAKLQRIGRTLANELERKLETVEESSALVILQEFGDILGPQRACQALVDAVKYGNIEVVMHLKSQMSILCPFNTLGHQAFVAALTPLYKRIQVLPNPVILETLLDALPISGSTCPCGELVPMDFYLHFDFYKILKDEERFIFKNALMNSENLLRILATRRLVPRAMTLKKVFRLFFSRCETLNFIATRFICLADWLDLTDIYHLEIIGSGKWFQVDYPDRDLFIFFFLRNMCGSKKPELRWDGLTAYLVRTPQRRDRFISLIQQFGLRIQYGTKSFRESEAYQNTRSLLSRNSMQSLQSLSRVQIYRTAREKSTEAFKNGEYLPLSRVINDICEEFFPHLRLFMAFLD